MCENILSETLEGTIQLNLLLQWLTDSNFENPVLHTDCLQADFISYFLNYIHEIQQINKEKSNTFKICTPIKPSGPYNDYVTPKPNKKRTSLYSTTPKSYSNDSYASPVSPLYNNANRSNSRICLGDFIINTPKNTTSKRQITRRIKPTSLHYNSSSVEFSKNSFSFNGVSDNTDGQRSVLAEECLKIVTHHKSPTCDLSIKSLPISNKLEIVPCLERVTFKYQLDKLIVIYNHLVTNNYVLNVISELHFVITVLLCKEYDEEDVSTVFNSLHNRVYFAANVLVNFSSILTLLDRTTLRLIVENKRLLNFVTLKPVDVKSDVENIEFDIHNENVCFISDTDNRTNFPNDVSFHAFRKQRDLFYEILRIWENNHLQEEWNFGMALGGKIRALLNMHGDAANMVHLARLFKAQCVMNICAKSNDDLSFISSISNINAEKLQRLKNRIVSKQASNGIHALPTFTGYEEFYHDFILAGAHHAFNKHLNDALISNIIELNNTKFECVGLDDTESIVEQSTKKSYIVCLKSLLILAKFLGFLDALPYTPQIQVLNVTSCYIQARNATQPNIDLSSIVDQTCKVGNLILTIPWLTEYLSMLDYTSLRLPYFETILHKLFAIYGADIQIPIENVLFIKINLGWLFELPHFPETLFFNWLKKNMCDKVCVTNSVLDALDIIDTNIVYMCCPYLNEIKQLLSNDITAINNTVKHITPLTTIQPTQKRLQLQLEEAFFNGQPISVRKTVEFVSERVASACVKHICNEMVPNFRKDVVCEFRTLGHDLQEIVLERMAGEQLKKLRKVIDDNVKIMIENRVSTAIDMLLASDVLIQTKNVCVNIAVQNCMERVQQWINSHVNTGIFIKDFNGEMKKMAEVKVQKPVFMLPTLGKNSQHNDNALSGKHCVESIRDMSLKLLEETENVSLHLVYELIDSIELSLNGRCDINDCILVLICKMLVDFVLLLLTHRPDLLNTKIEENLFGIWRQCDEGLFKTFISPRNIVILIQSSNIELTERRFSEFVGMLFKEQFLTEDIFELQVRTTYKQCSSKDMLKFLYNCLQCISSSDIVNKERITLFCNDFRL